MPNGPQVCLTFDFDAETLWLSRDPANAQRPGTLEEVERLSKHPDFTIANPNRLRALAGSFSVNQWVFNAAGGAGYRTYRSQIHVNVGCTREAADRLDREPLGDESEQDEVVTVEPSLAVPRHRSPVPLHVVVIPWEAAVGAG